MQLKKVEVVKIPEDIKVQVDGKKVTVDGPRGQLVRDFSYAPIELLDCKACNEVKVVVWFPRGKINAIARTIATHIENMITGVIRGYKYTMKAAHNHFPMEMSLKQNDQVIEIRNFLGMKQVNATRCEPGVKMTLGDDKKTIFVEGNDIERVGYTCAKIRQSCRIHNKDLRKFLDGVYIQQRGHIVE